MLTAAEELVLVAAWREEDDRSAFDTLVRSHMRLVVSTLLGYRGYGQSMSDMAHEGVCGLMTAIERFEPDLGHRLCSYAIWFVRAAMVRYILDNMFEFRLPGSESVRTLFFNLNRLRLAHGVAIGTAIPPDVVTEISRVLGVTAESVIDMDRVLSCPGASIDAPIGDSEDFCLRDILRDDSPSAEDMVGDREEEFLRQRAFGEALSCLTGRERDILASRCLRDDPETLESLGSRYSVSKERVRQIEVAAVRKLGVGVRGRIADRSGTLSLVAMR